MGAEVLEGLSLEEFDLACRIVAAAQESLDWLVPGVNLRLALHLGGRADGPEKERLGPEPAQR